MLTQEEKTLYALSKVPYVFTPLNKITEAVKGQLSEAETFTAFGQLLAEGKVKMNMGPKGPEYARDWNSQIEEERKVVSRELNTRLVEGTITYPRYDGYVANIEDNFIGEYANVLEDYGNANPEYTHWHKNAKTNVVYPPKLHALSSNAVLTANLLAGLELDPQQVEYAAEFEVIEAEPLHDRPEEISAPKVNFEAIINYGDGVDFVQTSFLESFYKPFRQSMWAYQFGNRYLFDNEEAIEKFRAFAKNLHFVNFDGYGAFKTIVALYSDILANAEEYEGKKVNVLNINWDLSKESSHKCLVEFQDAYFAEAKEAEAALNEFTKTLPLPEGTTLEYKFLTVSEVADSLANEEVKEYIKNRYLGF